MYIQRAFIITIVVMSSYFVGAWFSFAQFSVLNNGKAMIIKFSPAFPRPYDVVQAEVSTFSFDKDRASYSWYIDGVLANSGIGAYTTTFTASGLGTEKTITVVAKPQNGASLETSATVRVSDLDLLWSANTHTPAGYRGKALPTQGSTVQITAIPYFFIGSSRVNTNSLFYTWSLDDRVQQGSSGRGRDSMTVRLTSSPGIEHKITVSVSNDLQRNTQIKSVRIKVRRPKLNFYVLDLLRGPLYNKHLMEPLRVNAGSETQILAVPFFFSLSSLTHADYAWSVGNTRLPEPSVKPLILRYQTESESSATQRVNLSVENPINPLEYLQNSFLIHVE